MNLIFCLYSSSAEVTVLSELVCVVMGANPGLPTWYPVPLVGGEKVMQISRETKRLWVGGKVRGQCKEVSLGQHSQVLLRCRRLHFPRPQRPSSSSHSHVFLSLKKQKLGSPKSWKSEFVSENFDIWYYKVLLSQTLPSFGVKARQNGENKIPKRRVLSYEVARWVRMSVLQSGLLLRCDVLLLGMVPKVLTEGGPGQGDASSRVTCWRLVLHK